MNITNYTVKVIEPSSGYTLTQARDVEIQDRILSKRVCLAVNDSENNWKEIPDAEAELIRKAQEEYSLEQQKKTDDLSK